MFLNMKMEPLLIDGSSILQRPLPVPGERKENLSYVSYTSPCDVRYSNGVIPYIFLNCLEKCSTF